MTDKDVARTATGENLRFIVDLSRSSRDQRRDRTGHDTGGGIADSGLDQPLNLQDYRTARYAIRTRCWGKKGPSTYIQWGLGVEPDSGLRRSRWMVPGWYGRTLKCPLP